MQMVVEWLDQARPDASHLSDGHVEKLNAFIEQHLRLREGNISNEQNKS